MAQIRVSENSSGESCGSRPEAAATTGSPHWPFTNQATMWTVSSWQAPPVFTFSRLPGETPHSALLGQPAREHSTHCKPRALRGHEPGDAQGCAPRWGMGRRLPCSRPGAPRASRHLPQAFLGILAATHSPGIFQGRSWCGGWGRWSAHGCLCDRVWTDRACRHCWPMARILLGCRPQTLPSTCHLSLYGVCWAQARVQINMPPSWRGVSVSAKCSL